MYFELQSEWNIWIPRKEYMSSRMALSGLFLWAILQIALDNRQTPYKNTARYESFFHFIGYARKLSSRHWRRVVQTSCTCFVYFCLVELNCWFFMRQPGIEWHQGDCEEFGIRIPFARTRTSPTRTGELNHGTVNPRIFELNVLLE